MDKSFIFYKLKSNFGALQKDAMIQKAEYSNLDEILELTQCCARALQEKGIFQWSEHYPSLENFKSDIMAGELYILKVNEKICGVMALTSKLDEEYIPIEWLTANKRNLYVHRLATHPKIWGKGYGRELMDFAEDFARKNNFISVRLDTFSENPRNQEFYRKRGFTRLGNVYFPKQSEFPFYCYEKILE